MPNNIIDHESRQYYRHPSHVPIEIWQGEGGTAHLEQLNNVSLGGIAFESDSAWKLNSIITFMMVNDQSHQFTGKVVWCHKREHDNHFDVGVQFLKNQQDLVDDVCQFELYKKILFIFLDEFYESQFELNTV